MDKKQAVLIIDLLKNQVESDLQKEALEVAIEALGGRETAKELTTAVQMQFMRSKQRIYVLNQQGQVVKDYECRDDFERGHNENGEPRASLPNGNYWCYGELERFGPAYGTAYITTGDHRGRDIHGGGSSCADPYAPRQGWRMT